MALGTSCLKRLITKTNEGRRKGDIEGIAWVTVMGVHHLQLNTHSILYVSPTSINGFKRVSPAFRQLHGKLG